MKNRQHPNAQGPMARVALPILLILAGVTLTALGIARGEMGIVLKKALYVCLECMGIG
jgi:hypothetical protein